MKILVMTKGVPDTYGDRKLDLETGLTDRGASECVLDEICERAVEVAMSYADANEDTEVCVLSVSPASATATIRKCLALGADRAVHVVDDQLRGADLGLTAEVLAAAAKRIEFDLIITGNQSTDGSGGVIAAMLAENLGVPVLASLRSVAIRPGQVSGERATDFSDQQVTAALPAVISITESLPDARFPNFKGIMAAKKKPLDVLTLADLDVDAMDPAAARSIMLTVGERAPRTAGVKIVDQGDAGVQLAAFLTENRLV